MASHFGPSLDTLSDALALHACCEAANVAWLVCWAPEGMSHPQHAARMAASQVLLQMPALQDYFPHKNVKAGRGGLWEP